MSELWWNSVLIQVCLITVYMFTAFKKISAVFWSCVLYVFVSRKAHSFNSFQPLNEDLPLPYIHPLPNYKLSLSDVFSHVLNTLNHFKLFQSTLSLCASYLCFFLSILVTHIPWNDESSSSSSYFAAALSYPRFKFQTSLWAPHLFQKTAFLHSSSHPPNDKLLYW